MPEKLKKLARSLHPRRLTLLAGYLLKDEAISGKLIIGAVVLAIVAANTPLASAYESLWHTKLSIGLGSWSLSMDLRHWITDGLMAFFFLVVGLELRRELENGELRSHRTALLPFTAALGGMLVPAVIYALLNTGSDSIRGWAIPTATDIALAVGILALLGRRIPSSVRIFLLTLAIVDDVAAVIVIALFYGSGLNVPLELLAVAMALLMYTVRNTRLMTLPVFVLAGIVLWVIVYVSGIHSSITGAALGLLAPLAVYGRKPGVAERVERAVIPFSTLIVVPLFAFANTGVPFSAGHFDGEAAAKIAGGIIIGLVVGKVVGIVGASWLMVRLGLAKLPDRANWNHIIGVGMLAGIGFTVSIFVTELAFADRQFVSVAKISIFIASVLSATIGFCALRFLKLKGR